MKKKLLATVVTALFLTACGGGGSSNSSGGNTGGNDGGNGGIIENPNQIYTVEQLTDISNEYAQAWYQFNENPFGQYSPLTHYNYQDPYEFSFKDGKVFSKYYSALDAFVYPTYAYDTTILELQDNDTLDNVDGKQRIGILQGKPQLITEGGVKKLVISSKPYKGDSDLVITQKYIVQELNGKKIGQTANPSLYDLMNDSAVSSNFLNDDGFNSYIPALWNNHSSKLSSRTFTANTLCLNLESLSTNKPIFFSKTNGRVTAAERQKYEETHGLIEFAQIDNGTNTITKKVAENVPVYDGVPQEMSILVQPKGQPTYTAISYIGQYVESEINKLNSDLEPIDSALENILGIDVDAAYKATLNAQKKHAGLTCDLYNKEARNQLRSFLIEVNNRVD